MKKTTFLFFTCVLASFLAGCSSSDDEFLGSKTALVKTDTSYLVSKTQAIKEAVAFFYNLQGASAPNARQARVKKRMLADVANGEAKKQEGVYIINFANHGGYAVVSADKRDRTNVYLASIEGSFNENCPELQELLSAVKSYQASTISANTFNPDKGDGTTTQTTTVLANYGPLLSTCWHQNSPFNSELLKIYDATDPSMGCVTVAIGQIANYYRYPNAINGEILNWDLISSATGKEDSPTAATNAASRLLYLIGTGLGIKYPKEYGASFDDAKNEFSKLGYGYSAKSGFDIDEIKNQLVSKNPVWMCGSNDKTGHAWVVDGYMKYITKYRTYDDEGNPVENTVLNDYNYDETTEYIHFNLGWGENSLLDKYIQSEFSNGVDYRVWVNSSLFTFKIDGKDHTYDKKIKMICDFKLN